MVKTAIAFVLAITSFAAMSANAAQSFPLIPRKTLLGNPERAMPQISPDGKKIAFLAPLDGVMNVYVAPAGSLTGAKPVTSEKSRPIRSFWWTFTNKQILYLQDAGGDENLSVYAVDVATRKTTKLTNAKNARAEILGLSPRHPNEILVALNDRDPKWHDIWRIDVTTGQGRRVETNKDQIAYYLADANYNLRIAVRSTPDGGAIVNRRDGAAWKPFLTVPPGDAFTTFPQAVSADGAVLWMIDSRDRDKAILLKIDMRTGKAVVAGQNPFADVDKTVFDPVTMMAIAFGAEYERPVWTSVDPAVKPDLDALAKAVPGSWDVVSQSLDNAVWTLRIDTIVEPVKFATFDRRTKKLSPLFVARPTLVGAPLSPMLPRILTARDGLKMVAYLTLPKGSDLDGDGKPSAPLPMVLTVHGGPWARDSFGYDPNHHWLANRGYAALSVNYRGSTGFGKAFLNAADREWGGKMHDDLIDAVDWAIKQKIAQPDKIAIYGGSYGGYAALVGLSFTPKTFACGISIVGPSNLNTFLASAPPYLTAYLDMLKRRIGDPTTPAGRKLLTERSPLFRAGAIQRPLLIVHGANDPRVKQAESDQIVEAMKAKNIPVSYVLYADEGHGLARPENRLSYYAVAESFLGNCLGGRVQPVGDDFKGSSISVVTGKEFLGGVSEALGMSKPN